MSVPRRVRGLAGAHATGRLRESGRFVTWPGDTDDSLTSSVKR